MRHFRKLAIGLITVASFMATTAWAQSGGAHFQKASVSAAIQSNGNLIVSWQEAGVGNLQVSYTLAAGDATANPPINGVNAIYVCRTKSGGIPDANNKHTVNTAATSNGSFEPKNGKITGSLTLVHGPVSPL